MVCLQSHCGTSASRIYVLHACVEHQPSQVCVVVGQRVNSVLNQSGCHQHIPSLQLDQSSQGEQITDNSTTCSAHAQQPASHVHMQQKRSRTWERADEEQSAIFQDLFDTEQGKLISRIACHLLESKRTTPLPGCGMHIIAFVYISAIPGITMLDHGHAESRRNCMGWASQPCQAAKENSMRA